MRENAAEPAASASVLRKKVKQMLFDTGLMGEIEAHYALCSVWGMTVCYPSVGENRGKYGEEGNLTLGN